MSEKNPFTVLGFVPSAFHGLLDADIRTLVKSQYRALVTLLHPDHSGGNSERFKEVQEASEKLEEDFEFQFWKGLFLRPRQDQLAELHKKLEAAEQLAKEALGGLTAFWKAYCRGREIFTTHWRTAPGQSEQLEGFSVFNPPPLSILMIDRLELLTRQRAGTGPARVARWNDLETAAKVFELRHSSEWGMMRQNLIKTGFDPREKWRPSVRKEWIHFRSPPKMSRSFYWKPEGEPVVVQGKLLGSIPNVIVTKTRKAERHPAVKALITWDVQESTFVRLEQGFTLEEFKPVVPFIRPQLMNGNWVITAEDDADHTLRFKVLGYVTKILPLEESRSSTSSAVGEETTTP